MKRETHVSSRCGEMAIAVFLLTVGAFFFWGAWKMPPGSGAVPGPGTVPLIASSLLAATALGLLEKTLFAKPASADAPVEIRPGPVTIIFAALTGVAVVFDHAGFIVTLSVFLFVMLRVFSRLSTLRSAVAAVAISVAASWVFGSLLGVTLPHW